MTEMVSKYSSFDCQKNMPLPKIPDQATYYSRRIYIFKFTIVQGNSKHNLTKDNVFSYVWSELDRPTSSCEIASVVYHRLKNTVSPLIKKLCRRVWRTKQKLNVDFKGKQMVIRCSK